jgi:hypothetical protein
VITFEKSPSPNSTPSSSGSAPEHLRKSSSSARLPDFVKTPAGGSPHHPLAGLDLAAGQGAAAFNSKIVRLQSGRLLFRWFETPRKCSIYRSFFTRRRRLIVWGRNQGGLVRWIATVLTQQRPVRRSPDIRAMTRIARAVPRGFANRVSRPFTPIRANAHQRPPLSYSGALVKRRCLAKSALFPEARPNKGGGGGGTPANASLARISTCPLPTAAARGKNCEKSALDLPF